MSPEKSPNEVVCQIQSVPQMAEPGATAEESFTLSQRLKLVLKRSLTTRFKKTMKDYVNKVIEYFPKSSTNAAKEPLALPSPAGAGLKVGDWVRVLSREEIQKSLDHWEELKGCGFMDEMWRYCGTEQQVFKRVERFVDERDYRIKKTTGVVLLNGVICEGTKLYGRCDRSCFFFWREEWLVRVDAPVDTQSRAVAV